MTQSDCALLIIDVQRSLFQHSTPIYQAEALLENINTLAARAHQAGAPVIYIQHADNKSLIKDSEGWQLHPLLAPLESDLLIHKQHGNAFQETYLNEELSALEVKTVVICGLVTQGCVRATSLGALQLGYKVILAKDAHSNYSKNAAQIINKWHKILSEKGVELRLTEGIKF